jgi:hypothetical protein
MNTGSIITGRPSMGSWLLYGLGADTDNLPGFVVLMSQGRGGQNQPIANRQWSAGFLPSKFQGVKLNSIGDPVLYINNPQGLGSKTQQDSIEAINQLNRLQYARSKRALLMAPVAEDCPSRGHVVQCGPCRPPCGPSTWLAPDRKYASLTLRRRSQPTTCDSSLPPSSLKAISPLNLPAQSWVQTLVQRPRRHKETEGGGGGEVPERTALCGCTPN